MPSPPPVLPCAPRRAGLAAALACAATLGCGTAPAPAPLRLLADATGGEATLPAGAVRPPREIRPAEMGQAPPGGRVGRVVMYGQGAGQRGRRALGHELRAALLAPTPAEYRYRVRLPARALLRLGLGYQAEAATLGVPVRFTVAVAGPEGTAQTVAEETLPVRLDGEWRDLEIALDRWAGEEVTLRLAAASPAGSPPLWAAFSSPEVVDRERPEGGFDVLLVSLDTLRADHLGCYGYTRRPTSPHLDALAASAIRFAWALSQAPWTRPSHRSLLTGLYPSSKQGLASPTLGEMLHRAGYRTTALTAGGMMHYSFGFDEGFEVYRTEDWLADLPRLVDRLERGRGRRDFLFLHTYAVHDPYVHGEFARRMPAGRLGESFGHQDYQRLRDSLTAQEKAYAEALYDGGIAHADARLGELLAAMERRGLLGETLLVLTSDHGEQFWEHGYFRHGQNLFDHQLHVPLILRLPDALASRWGGEAAVRGRVIAEQVQLADLYPTILDLAGAPPAHRLQGRSLVPLLAGEPVSPAVAFAENTIVETERKSLRTSRYKLVRGFVGGRQVEQALYDLAADPGERLNRIAAEPQRAAELGARLEEILRGGEERELWRKPRGAARGAPDAAGLAAPLREQLEALGYVEVGEEEPE